MGTASLLSGAMLTAWSYYPAPIGGQSWTRTGSFVFGVIEILMGIVLLLRERKQESTGRLPEVAAPAQPSPDRTQNWLRENLEAIAVAIVLALLIRQYAVEAFVIPTGSMAPVLLGAHLDLECTNCGKPQSIGVPEDLVSTRGRRGPDGDLVVSTLCSNCRADFENHVRSGVRVWNRDLAGWPFGSVSRGDRILVDKFIYRFQPPKRYEIAVFKYPQNPLEDFIKRLVGLPGETIDVENGDIFIDGKIARKPDDVQASVWRPVHESRYVEKDGGGARGPAWRGESGEWSKIDDGRGWRGTSALEDVGWLVYNREIRDWNPYNESIKAGGGHTVGDVRVLARVPGSGKGAPAGVLERIAVDGDVIEAEVAPRGSPGGPGAGSDGTATLRWRGQEVARQSIPDSSELILDLAHVDAAITFKVNGTLVGRIELDDRPPQVETSRVEVRVGVRGGAIDFRELDVYRDTYYLTSIPLGGSRVQFPYSIPEGRYFFLGDNSSNSQDSRAWETVPAGHIVGRAFMVFWPALPGDFAVRRIR